jgi:phage terminase small subunit
MKQKLAFKATKLTKKQKVFVAEYLKDSNGTRAAIEAGYSTKYAKESAYHLIHKNTLVMEAIQREEESRLKRLGVESAQVLSRMAKIGYVDIRKIYDPETNTLLPVKDFPDDIVPAIAGIETLEVWEGRGEDRHLVGYTKKVRLWNPNPALTNMAKNLGVIGNGKHEEKEEETEEVVKGLTSLQVSQRIVYYIKLAVERVKKMEAEKEEGTQKQE